MLSTDFGIQNPLGGILVTCGFGDEVVWSGITGEDGAVIAVFEAVPSWVSLCDPSDISQASRTRSPLHLLPVADGSSNIDAEVRAFLSSVVLGGPVPYLDLSHALIEVYFGTDRLELGDGHFGSERALFGRLTTGACTVSIPRDHRMAHLERPTRWRFWQQEHIERHFVILERRVLTEYEFIERALLDSGDAKDLLLFIHGYNVSFDAAIYRTAQIGYDLGFNGICVAFSWPSAGQFHAYLSDLNNCEWSSSHLATFMSWLFESFPGHRIHVIAHSMGNRALATAIQRLGMSDSRKCNQVMMTAPDLDSDVFREVASALTYRSSQVTLYASTNDDALKAAKVVQGGYPRAGDASSIVVVPGVDTVDASTVDTNLSGHSYYADNRSVLSDMHWLVTTGARPDQRFGLRAAGVAPSRYWVFKR